ncbi:hypothetical protein DRO64_10395, partial [Candidatus Bathyarchaeota archaeon]
MPIQIITNLISQFVAFLPRIIGAIIILIIGWA